MLTGSKLLRRILPSWRRHVVDELELDGFVRRHHAEVVSELDALIARHPDRVLASSQRRKGCDDVCSLVMKGALLCGAKTFVHVSSQTGVPREIPSRFCLVRASDVRPSHNPMEGFKPTEGYPPGTQERRYGTESGEQIKVIGIARNPKAHLIYNTGTGASDGTPIVTPTGIVLGGNGRTMGTQLHYHNGGYVIADYIREVAPDFGFDPDEVQALRFAPGDGPMIVRVIDIPQAEWRQAVRALNVPLTQALDATAEAVAFAKQLPPEAFDYLASALADSEMSLTEFLVSQASRPFVDALRRTDLITGQNATRMLSEGGLLSESGRALVSNALAAALSPDPDLLDAANVSLRNALARSAPYWLAAASYGGGWDLRESLDRAIRDFLAFKSSKGYGTLDVWKRQGGLLERRKTEGDPVAERLLEILDKNPGPIQLSKVARHFMKEAATFGGGQATMFASKTPLEVLNEKPGGPQVMLFGESLPRARFVSLMDDEIVDTINAAIDATPAGAAVQISFGPCGSDGLSTQTQRRAWELAWQAGWSPQVSRETCLLTLRDLGGDVIDPATRIRLPPSKRGSGEALPRFREALDRGAAAEFREHPWAGKAGARRIAADHLREDPHFYDKSDSNP